MKKKIASLILSFAMVISCLFALTACGGKKKNDGSNTEPPVVDTNPVSSISVELVSTDFVMTNGTITFEFGTKVELDAEDFKVTANMKDQTTKEIPLKTDTVEGYTFASTVPAGDPTAAGDYKLTFKYSERQAEVNVKVNKGTVDMTDVKWEDGSKEFTYDKSEHSVRIDESTLPEGVTVSYENNAKTNAGEYTAIARFTYEDATNYEAIAPMTCDWKIKKATYNVSSIGMMTGYPYTGSPITASLQILPQNITATLVSGSLTQTEIGVYEVEYAFTYTGEDAANYEPIQNRVLKFEIIKGNVYSQVMKVFKWTGDVQTLSKEDVILPEGITIDEFVSGHEQTNIGSYVAVAKLAYTEEAKEFYKEVETINIYWTITKATYSFTNVVWSRDDVSAPLYYTGTEYTVELLNLPQGITATYSNNKGTNAGTYVTTATFTYDTEHYHAPYISPLTWVINKKTLIVKANDVTVEYGIPAKNYLTVTYDGFIENENENNSLSGELNFLISNYSVNSSVGEYEIAPYNLKSKYNNYEIQYENGTLTVIKRKIDVSAVEWDYDPTKPYTYKGSQYAPKLKDIPAGVNVTYTYKLGEETVLYPKDAGTYTATAVFGATNSNYEIINNGEVEVLTWVIKKAKLIVTVGKEISYGEIIESVDDVLNLELFYEGFVGSDNAANSLTGTVVYIVTFDYMNDGTDNVGEYLVDIIPNGEGEGESTLFSKNYEIEYGESKIVVKKAKIVLTDLVWNYKTPYTYSGTPHTPQISNIPVGVADPTYVYKDANGDVVNPIDVGVYTVEVEIIGTSNYEIEGTVDGITFEISKKDVTVTFANQEIDYYTEPSQTEGTAFTVTGLVGLETIDDFDSFEITFGDWEISANAGSTFEISATCEDNNYNISVVPATLSIIAARVSLDGVVWQEISEFTYNKGEQYPRFDATSKLPSYVEYTYNFGSELIRPINADSYTVTIQFEDTNNYLIDGTVEAKSFEIQKATIDESKIYWNAGSAELNLDGDYEVYYDGSMYTLELVNETGLNLVYGNLIVPGLDNFEAVSSGREVSAIGLYHFGVTLSLNEQDAQNYNDLNEKEYYARLLIKDFIKCLALSYYDIKTGEEDSMEIYDFQDVTTVNLTDVVVKHLGHVLAGESNVGMRICTNVALTNYMTECTDINVFENTLYLEFLKYEDNSLLDVRPIKINLNYTITTPDGDEVVAVSKEPLSFITENENSEYTLSPIKVDGVLISSQLTPWDEGEDDYDAYALMVMVLPGINKAKFQFTYAVGAEDDKKNYTFEKEISIVVSAKSETYCDVENNVLETNIDVTQITTSFDPNSISLHPHTGYKEVENSREIQIVNGAHYLVVEYEPDPNYTFTPYSVELYDDSETVRIYILLRLRGLLDKNTNAKIVVQGVNGNVDYDDKIIYVSQGHAVEVRTENESAVISYVNNQNNNVEEFTHMTMIHFEEIGEFYIDIKSTYYVVYQTGAQGETWVRYRVFVSSAQGGGQGPSGPVVNDSDVSYNVSANDMLGNWIDSNGEIVEYSSDVNVPVIEVEEGDDFDTLTLSNWNETKYINIWGNSQNSQVVIGLVTDSNCDGYEEENISEDEVVIIEGPINNAVYNFRQAGMYYVCIIAGDEQTTRLLIINVEGDFTPFLEIEANDKTVTEHIDEEFNTSGDFVWFMSAEEIQGEPEESEPETRPVMKENLEAYVGEVSELGATYEISISSGLSNFLYNVKEDGSIDEESKITLVDGKVTLAVREDENGFKYVKFVIANLNQTQLVSSDYYVWVFLCDKADRLSYHTLTVGNKEFEFNLDILRYGDYGDVVVDNISGLGFVYVDDAQLNEDGTFDVVFNAYEGYEIPENSLDYVFFTEEGILALMGEFEDELPSYEEFYAFVQELIANDLAFQELNIEINVPLTEDGMACIYLLGGNTNAETYENIGMFILPLTIVINQYQFISIVYDEDKTLTSSVEVSLETEEVVFHGDFENTLMDEQSLTLEFEAQIDYVLTGLTDSFTLDLIDLNSVLNLFYVDEESETYVVILDANNMEDGFDFPVIDLVSEGVELVVNTETNSVSFKVVQYEEGEIATTATFTIYFAEEVAA